MLQHTHKNCRKICLDRRLQRVELFWWVTTGGDNQAFGGRFPVNQPNFFSRVCASWFPTPSERSNENEESPRRCMASVRQGTSEQQISTKSHRSTVAASSTVWICFERPALTSFRARRPDNVFTGFRPSSEHFPVWLSSFPSGGCPQQIGATSDVSERTEVMVVSKCLCALEFPSWSSHWMPLQNCTQCCTRSSFVVSVTSFEASVPRPRQSCPLHPSPWSRCLSKVTFASEPPALKPMMESTLTSFEQCDEECNVDEGHISHNWSTLRVGLQCNSAPVHAVLDKVARIPTVVWKSSRPIEICGISTFRPGFVDFSGHQSPFATNSNVF